MLQINYHKNPKDLEDLKHSYINFVFNPDLADKLKKYFNQKSVAVPKPPTLKKLLLMPLEDLYKESGRVDKYIKTPFQKLKLKKILNYDIGTPGYSGKKQPSIAKFFSENDKKINLSTCYYCNIDYVSAFSNIGDYKDELDFINRARKFELMSIKGIDEKSAKIIMVARNRKKILDIDKLPSSINSLKKTYIKGLIVEEKSNHFTLDHVLDKADFPLAAISLFNLVPSCYSCNSKFKNRKKLISHKSKIFLSPSSKSNSFATDFGFKLLFANGKSGNLNLINKIEDFLLDFDLKKNQEDYELFLNTFKIHSRYVLHKKEAFDLILKKKNYNDAHIKQIAKIVGISEAKIKIDIFGKQLFEGELEDYPLTKLKRDVAKTIGIKGVK